MFDITKLAATDTSTVELVGGDDAPLHDADGNRLSITVYGPGTRIYQRAQARQQNLLVDKIKKRGRMDQTAEEKLADSRQLQGYLANRVASHLQGKGKTVIAWNETALGGNLDPAVILQLWNDDPKDPALKALGGTRDESGKLTGPNQGIGSKHLRRGGKARPDQAKRG